MVLMLVWSVVGTATSWLLRRAHAISGRLLLVVSLGVSAAGLVGLAVLAPGASLWRLLPGIVVLGVGYGGANAALGREAIAHVPPARAGMGSGTSNTARYLGSALGVTLAALLATPTAAPAALLSGFDATVLSGRGTLGGRRRARRAARRAAPGSGRSPGDVDRQPAPVVLRHGEGQAGRRAEGVQVVAVERADVPPARESARPRTGTATTARRRATRSISASTVASSPRGRCSSRCTAKTVSADASRRGTASASPARVVTGVPSAADTLPSRLRGAGHEVHGRHLGGPRRRAAAPGSRSSSPARRRAGRRRVPRPRSCDRRHAGVRPAGLPAARQRAQCVAVEGRPGGYRLSCTTATNASSKVGGVEETGDDQVVGDPAGEVVAERVRRGCRARHAPAGVDGQPWSRSVQADRALVRRRRAAVRPDDRPGDRRRVGVSRPARRRAAGWLIGAVRRDRRRVGAAWSARRGSPGAGSSADASARSRGPPARVRSDRAPPARGCRTPRRRAGRSCPVPTSTGAPASARPSRAPGG